MASPCSICNSNDAQVCKQCHSSPYCSVKCQKIDWPCHKLLCSEYKLNNERPSPTHKRGILFDPEKLAPSFVWVRCDVHHDGPEVTYEVPDLKELAGPDYRPMTCEKFWKNYVRGRELKQLYELWMRDNFMNDGSSRNKSAAVATKGQNSWDWRGPLIALKYTSLEYNEPYADMDMQDFREAVDYLTYYTNEVAWSKYWTRKY